jgi:hypothetical protein
MSWFGHLGHYIQHEYKEQVPENAVPAPKRDTFAKHEGISGLNTRFIVLPSF